MTGSIQEKNGKYYTVLNAEKSVLRRLDAFHRGEQKEHRRTDHL